MNIASMTLHKIYCDNCGPHADHAITATGSECLNCGLIELFPTPNNDD